MKKSLILLISLLSVNCKHEPYYQYEHYNPIAKPIQNYQPKHPKPPWSSKIFKGSWLTTKNRRLNGTMSCAVTSKGFQLWNGKFSGQWKGSNFQYEVDFSGPLDNLVGNPISIDGANYQWNGSIQNNSFNGKFSSYRYHGSFSLDENNP